MFIIVPLRRYCAAEIVLRIDKSKLHVTNKIFHLKFNVDKIQESTPR